MSDKSNVRSFLRFNLDTEEGRQAHNRACKSEQAFRSLREIDDKFREYERYRLQPEFATLEFDCFCKDAKSIEVTPKNKEDLWRLIYGLRREILKIMEENGIDLDNDY